MAKNEYDNNGNKIRYLTFKEKQTYWRGLEWKDVAECINCNLVRQLKEDDIHEEDTCYRCFVKQNHYWDNDYEEEE